MFDGNSWEIPEMNCAALWQSLPLVYSSLGKHQKGDSYCADLLSKIQASRGSVDSFQIWKDLLCFYPKRAKRRIWLVPVSLRPMLLNYFHTSVLSGNLGSRKTFQKIATNFWWPRMRLEIFDYVRRCDLCQREKPAKDARVGLHASNPCSQLMERLFVDFVGPLTRMKRGNLAILVVVDGFSKFVSFFSVRKISSQVVSDCLERSFFQPMARLLVL